MHTVNTLNPPFYNNKLGNHHCIACMNVCLLYIYVLESLFSLHSFALGLFGCYPLHHYYLFLNDCQDAWSVLPKYLFSQ